MKDKTDKKERRTKKSLIINAIGFSAILILGFEESSIFVNIFISLFVVANLLMFILWEKLKENMRIPINLLAAVVAFVTAYDYYSKDSHYVYIIWFILGIINIVYIFIKKDKEKI